MKTPLAGFIAVWLLLLTFGAAALPCLAGAVDVMISKMVGNPPTLNMKIGISVTIEPCDTGRYYYNYYYINEAEGVTVLLEERATECEDHEMSISMPKKFLLDNPVYFKVKVSSELSEVGTAQMDIRDCELGGEWVRGRNSYKQPYKFTPGWNLKCLPCGTPGTATASAWLTNLRSQDVLATKIRRWTGSDWQTYTLGDTSGDFDVRPGWGYFIYSESSGSWTRGVYKPGVGSWLKSECSGCWDVTFEDGWNLVGGYLFNQTTAKSLLYRLQSQGIDKIMRWDGSGWQTYTKDAPFGNFDLDYNVAYFIHKNP